MNICWQLILQIVLNMATGDLANPSEVKDMAVSNTHFTFDLLRECGADKKGENVFFAPFSITTTLAMTCMGAAGNTKKEMKQVLRWSQAIPKEGFGSYLPLLKKAAGEQTPGYTLVGAQRIYVDKAQSLKDEFGLKVKKHFDSESAMADFKSNHEGERKNINSWVSDQTRGKISDLLPAGSLSPLTAMVLIQAIYFKGNWMHKFDAKRTHPADFTGPQGKIKVSMMEQTHDFNHGVSKELKCSAVELPYASNDPKAPGHDLSMLILLPDATDGLQDLEASLDNDKLQAVRKTMHSSKVNLKLPRFSVECSFELKKVLSKLGMPTAFGEGADFSAMAKEELSISEVYHKAVVEVNEEGTVAAAATAAVMMMRSMPIIRPFIVDHPFLFFIIDKRADVILFVGRMVNPQSAAAAGQREDL